MCRPFEVAHRHTVCRLWINTRARLQVYAYGARSARIEKREDNRLCYAYRIIEPNSRKRPLRDSTARRWHHGSQPRVHGAVYAKTQSTTIILSIRYKIYTYSDQKSRSKKYFFTILYMGISYNIISILSLPYCHFFLQMSYHLRAIWELFKRCSIFITQSVERKSIDLYKS